MAGVNYMSPTENKAIVRRYVEECFNRNNPALVDELCSPTFQLHDPGTPTTRSGPAALKEVLSIYHSAFPDVQLTIEEQIAEGDRVATRWTGRGTHRGELMGVSPTGRQVTVSGIQIDRISGGKFVEGWTNWDTLGMLQQLGAVAAQAQAATARTRSGG
jgi:steroid delta-isomerase-like uncharacterized protein